MSKRSAHYAPFVVGERFRIVPPGAPVATDGRVHIVMARGAFGSGEHETTRSCLEVLEGMPMTGRAVLDVGSGTGILAIACLELGAAHAVCVDISAEATASARTNAVLNGLEERTTHVCGVLSDVAPGRFDVVLANIYGDLLLQLGAELAARARPGGSLVLSGILWEDEFPVRAEMQRLGGQVVQQRMLEEYATLVVQM